MIFFRKCFGNFFTAVTLVAELGVNAAEYVDVADHFVGFEIRNQNRNDFGEFFRNGLHRVAETCVFLIDAVDKHQCRNFVFGAVFQRFFRAYRQGACSARYDDCAIGNGKRFQHFTFEIEVAGNVDKVDFRSFVGAICYRKTDGYVASRFFGLEVHSRVAVVDFTHSVDCTGIVQYRFGKRGFTFTAVTDKSNVTNVFCKNCHIYVLLKINFEFSAKIERKRN